VAVSELCIVYLVNKSNTRDVVIPAILKSNGSNPVASPNDIFLLRKVLWSMLLLPLLPKVLAATIMLLPVTYIHSPLHIVISNSRRIHDKSRSFPWL